MSLRWNVIVFAMTSILAVLPISVAAQSTTSCVEPSFMAFRAELEGMQQPLSRKGLSFLKAYGLIQSTQTCLQHTSYPANLQAEADQFRNDVDFLVTAFDRAVRRNEAPPIFAMSSGGSGGVELTVPKSAPTAAPNQPSGVFMLSLEHGKRLQRALSHLGHYDGEIDGVIGNGSFQAIRLYQQSIGARPTGVLSREQLIDLF